MTTPDIPASVLQFIAERIDTVPELETLLIMSAEESRSWSVKDIAARTYVAPRFAAAILRALCQRRLIAPTDDSRHYRFRPTSEDERQIVAETARVYRLHLIPVANFIHNKASTPVQEFARAFSLKKDP
jgi:hypothetical protein